MNVLTSHSVREINYESERPLVTANNQTFEADYVLVTVPLSVLKRDTIQFFPGLPRDKVGAINALDMDTLNKVYLKIRNAFWQDEAKNFGYINDPKGQFTYWINLSEATHEDYPSTVHGAFLSGEREANRIIGYSL